MRIVPLTMDIYDTHVDCKNVPVVDCNAASTIEGNIEFKMASLTATPTCTATVYRLVAPTSTEPRWSRTGSDLYAAAVLHVDILEHSNARWGLFWRFDPSAITPAVVHKQHYGLSFPLNATESSDTAHYRPDVVIRIFNDIDVTA